MTLIYLDKGHDELPTQTMHYHTVHPSKFTVHFNIKFDPLKNGSHLTWHCWVFFKVKPLKQISPETLG